MYAKFAITTVILATAACSLNRLTPAQRPPLQIERQNSQSGAQEIPPYEYGYKPAVLIVAANARRAGAGMNAALNATAGVCQPQTDRVDCEAYAREIVTQLYWPDRGFAADLRGQQTHDRGSD